MATSNYYPLDFRLIASSQFQILALLCRTVDGAVSDAVKEFALSQMISSKALFHSTFDVQIAALVEQLQAVTIAGVHHIDQLLALSMAQNRMVSGLRTNFYTKSIPGSNTYNGYSVSYANNFSNTNISSLPTDEVDRCFCSDTLDCHYPSGFFNTSVRIVPNQIMWPYPTPLFFVRGMQSSCVPRNSMLQSTLECFFDQICLNMVISFTNALGTVIPLNATPGLSRFSPNTTVQTIFDALMIESWHNTSNFGDYFRECAAQLCTYSYSQRFSIVYMITTLVSLVGGLSMAVRILSLLLVRVVIRKIQAKLYPQSAKEDNDEGQLVINREKSSIQEHVARLLSQVRDQLMTINLFKKTLADSGHGIHSTRVYIILLIIAALILTIYSSVIRNTQSITIDNPTLAQFEEFLRQYPSTLSCPCERLSMTHSSIIAIQARYHQVCSSIFVRNDGWLKYWPLNSINQSNTAAPSFFGLDFRVTGATFFNLLQTFCDLASDTITNALVVFNSTYFVNAQPLGRDAFYAQTSTLLNQFTKQTTASFAILFELVYTAIRLNQFLIAGSSNAVPTTRQINGSLNLRFTSKKYLNGNITCSCGSSSSCTRPQGFYCQALSCHSGNALPNRTIPGFNLGCFPVDSILLSTLECLYNQACIQMVIDWRLFDFAQIYLPVNLTNITALDPHIPSQFSPNRTLEVIISQLFVENWTTHADYAAHYSQCQPDSCTYTFIQQHQPIFVITSVISLMGGLTVVLRLLVPPLVKIARRIYHRRQIDTGAGPRRSLGSYIVRALQSLRTLNVYERESASGSSVLATRIYLVLLMISFTIISVFVGLQQQTRSFTIHSPTEAQFESLRSQYPAALSCPCSQLAIQYGTFLVVSPVLHQVCSSPLISSNWSTSLFNKGDIWVVPDWFLISAHFRLLSWMCQLAESSIDQSIFEFISSELINTETLSFDLFQFQISSAITMFIEQSPNAFRRTLAFIIDTYRSNQLQDRYMSSWQTIFSTPDDYYIFHTIPLSHNNNTCTCAAGMSSCWRSLNILNSNNNIINFSGFIGGCLPIDGLRQSTFVCLYDQICLNQIIQLINISTSIVALNSSYTTRYPHNTTSIAAIIDQLFIESWVNSSNYSSYFQECAPSTCRYYYVERNNILYILTTLLGLYGGLTIVLRIIVWHGLRLILLFLARCRQSTQVVPTIAIE